MNIQEKIDKINNFIANMSWCDFEVHSLHKGCLSIVGSIDLSYFHNIEICFHGFFFVSSVFDWKSDTSKPVLSLMEGELAERINLQYHVEIGNHVFKFITEYDDSETNCVIVARDITYNTQTVKYN